MGKIQLIERITCAHCKDQDACLVKGCPVWFAYEIEDERLAKKARGEIIDNCTSKVFKALKKNRRW